MQNRRVFEHDVCEGVQFRHVQVGERQAVWGSVLLLKADRDVSVIRHEAVRAWVDNWQNVSNITLQVELL